MIEVRIGTTDALEVREDELGNQSTHPVDGERTVSFLMPDGVTSMDASTQVIGALNGVMMEVGAKPWWIESNDQAVAGNLMSHYGVDLNQMPERWGDGSTTNPQGYAQAVQKAAAPPPDQQDESTPVLPEGEPQEQVQTRVTPASQPEVEGDVSLTEPIPAPAPNGGPVEPEQPVGDL
jgi:hypothetical protein